MIIGSIAVALAGVWPGVIWYSGWWTEKYHWQPSPSDLNIFLFLIGPAALILVFYGAVTLILGLFNWLSNKATLPHKPLTFGRGARIAGMLGAFALIASLGAIVGMYSYAAENPAQDVRFLGSIVSSWPQFYTITAGVVLVLLLVGWIFTPRKSVLVDDRQDVK
jgi:hypothetical protein